MLVVGGGRSGGGRGGMTSLLLLLETEWSTDECDIYMSYRSGHLDLYGDAVRFDSSVPT
jgi:hypothetical protein